MNLVFINLVDSQAIFFTYRIPLYCQSMISEYLNLTIQHEYMFTFGSFLDFNQGTYGKAVDYLFEHMVFKLERKVVGENENEYQVSYDFSNKDEIIKELDSEQMLFLAAILHNLNMKPELLAITKILMDELNMSFDHIKAYGKSDRFKMSIYTK